jgi:hypothetical protein
LQGDPCGRDFYDYWTVGRSSIPGGRWGRRRPRAATIAAAGGAPGEGLDVDTKWRTLREGDGTEVSVAVEPLLAARSENPLPERLALQGDVIRGADRPMFEQRELEIFAAVVTTASFHEVAQLRIAAVSVRDVFAPA